MKLDAKAIGKRIARRRKEQGYTQDRLSEAIGISPNHISDIERGLSVPTTQIIFKICGVLGETPDYYLIGKPNKQTDEIVELVRTLTPEAQTTLCALLKTYVSTQLNN